MSSDLAAFVGARLAEDEAVARSAVGELDGGHWPLGYPVLADQGQSTHIARHDPVRVLREVQARRIVLAEYAAVAKNEGHDDVEYADGWVAGLGMAVRAMAAAWNDHADYRTDWTPRS